MWSFIFPGFGEVCMTVFEDNEGAKHLAQNPKCTSNSKHIDVRHHLLRKLVFKGEFIIAHVETDEQHADFLTKPLHLVLHGFLLPPGFSDEYLMHLRDKVLCYGF